jgi:drug/metabolite transporter (DMT)-like permease
MTINPVFASAVGALTLGEPIGINLVVGLVAVFAGIWIATSESAAKKHANLPT